MDMEIQMKIQIRKRLTPLNVDSTELNKLYFKHDAYSMNDFNVT